MKSNLPIEIKKEIAEVFAAIRKYPEAKKLGTDLISHLKSEYEGRGTPAPESLARLRKAFKALTSEE